MSLEELEAEQGGLVDMQDQLQTEIRQLERQMQATRTHAAAVRDAFQKVGLCLWTQDRGPQACTLLPVEGCF